jgi:hypothetical protein
VHKKLNSKEAPEGKEAFRKFQALASALVKVPKAEINQRVKQKREQERKTP